MSHYVSLCLIMSHYVSLCLIMSHYVSLCLIMSHRFQSQQIITDMYSTVPSWDALPSSIRAPERSPRCHDSLKMLEQNGSTAPNSNLRENDDQWRCEFGAYVVWRDMEQGKMWKGLKDIKRDLARSGSHVRISDHVGRSTVQLCPIFLVVSTFTPKIWKS